MNQGYIKFYRKTLESMVFQSPELLKLWCLCLLKAAHKETWITITGINEPVLLQPGQFVTGRYSLHKEYYKKQASADKSPLTVWRWLELLEKHEMLNIKTNNKYSLITIINWGSYQINKIDNEQDNEQQMNNRRTTDEQQMNTNKNVLRMNKNVKNKDIPSFFEKFWKIYPKKKSKGQAEKAFSKINPDEQLLATMIAKIEQAKKSEDWIKENGKYIPYPATWLNAIGWEDEPIEQTNNIIDPACPNVPDWVKKSLKENKG